jgi:LacI family transcriptional regulator
MSNINDVAKRAGVSSITVSRVINNSSYVSETTRKKVDEAIAELGYVPNKLASGLRSKRSDTLALVITDITNPFFTLIARGVEDVASASGYTVFFCNTDESEEKEINYSNILVQQQVDGVLLVPACSSPKSVQFLDQNKIPVVLIDRSVPSIQKDIVRCNSEEGAYDLVKLLTELGHKNIVMISGPKGVSTSDDRVAGYNRAMKEAGLESLKRILYGSFTQTSGYELTNQALQFDPPPSALFGANNFLSIGILKALRDAGKSVPEDIAVVGFDDLPVTMVVNPFLTVAAQPAYEMGKKATELLLDRLSGKATEGNREIMLPTEIIKRQSSGKPLDR